MRQAKQDPDRQPTLARSPVEPARVVTETLPPQGTPPQDDAGSVERRIVLGSGSGIELQYPARLVWPSPWVGHIPFAFWLVEALRPRVVVELGVHSGNSYCAFLQAIESLGLPAQCYGIDHWRGDDHADHYGDDVYADLCSYHDPLYGTFSTLIRSTFEEAVPYFSDRSVDLLHIDGFHTYEAVAKDLSAWLPKMSPRGVVLFHDINVREREFGVWRLWEEIATRYQTLAFVHSHGLGLAYLGSDPPPSSLRTLLAISDPEIISRTRSYFARLGTSLIDRFARRQAETIAGRVRTSEAALDAAQSEIVRHAETVDALRIEVAKATAQVALLQNELGADRAEVARGVEVAARLQQALSASRGEAARQAEAAARLEQALSVSRADTARQAELAARFHQELSALRAEAARQTEAAARLQHELSVARAETARQAEAASALTQQCAEARSALARQSDAASIRQQDAQNATKRLVLHEGELEASRAEVARQREAADAARAATVEVTGQAAALGEELSRARGQVSLALADRERATQLLRQQIAATAGLQRELAALRPNRAVAALVNRLATVKHMIPRPAKRYIKKRILGLRTEH